MNSILKKLTRHRDTVDYSSVMVIYKSDDSSWRGFVVPYDITYEADTKEEVREVLSNMIPSYTEALAIYNNPSHLADIPLSDKEDETKWSRISWDVLKKLKSRVSKIEQSDYYAEAQLPA